MAGTRESFDADKMGASIQMIRFPILVVALALLLGLGCAGTSSSFAAENGFLFSNPQLQKAFASALTKEHVRFRQLEDGTVTYSPADEAKVKKIQMSILESSFTPAYRFEDGKLQAKFADRLKSQGIDYAIERREGKSWITWSQNDDAKVRRIREEILDGSISGR